VSQTSRIGTDSHDAREARVGAIAVVTNTVYDQQFEDRERGRGTLRIWRVVKQQFPYKLSRLGGVRSIRESIWRFAATRCWRTAEDRGYLKHSRESRCDR
jgi:hypothetical protein